MPMAGAHTHKRSPAKMRKKTPSKQAPEDKSSLEKMPEVGTEAAHKEDSSVEAVGEGDDWNEVKLGRILEEAIAKVLGAELKQMQSSIGQMTSALNHLSNPVQNQGAVDQA